MKVAITAYACKSTVGSEPGAGFWWTAMASDIADDVWLITRPLDSQTRILLRNKGVNTVEVPVRHNARYPQLCYVLWLIRAQVRLRQLHARYSFDLTHHVTYASDWLPSPSVRGVPHIWGPVGGSTSTPKNLVAYYPKTHRAKDYTKSFMLSFLRPLVGKWARKNVSLILAQNSDTASVFSSHPKVVVRPNCVVDLQKSLDEAKPVLSDESSPRAALVGRLIGLKGGAIAIRAFADERLRHWTLHFYGDGPERQSLQNLAKKLGVDHSVIFHGQLDREQILGQISDMTCVLSVSAHEGVGWSVAEALAIGTPVVTWSHGGPAELVIGSSNGIVVDPGHVPISSLVDGVCKVESLSPSAGSKRFSLDNLKKDLANWYNEYAL